MMSGVGSRHPPVSQGIEFAEYRQAGLYANLTKTSLVTLELESFSARVEDIPGSQRN